MSALDPLTEQQAALFQRIDVATHSDPVLRIVNAGLPFHMRMA